VDKRSAFADAVERGARRGSVDLRRAPRRWCEPTCASHHKVWREENTSPITG